MDSTKRSAFSQGDLSKGVPLFVASILLHDVQFMLVKVPSIVNVLYKGIL